VDDPSTGLSYPRSPLVYAITGFSWNGTPEQASRDGLSKGRLHGGSGGWTMKLAAAAGEVYVLDILALDKHAPAGRNFDVLVDGGMVRNDWFIPVGTPYNRVLRVRLVADADGIDLSFQRGNGPGDGNPAISALALTQEWPDPPTLLSVGPSQTQSAGGTAEFAVDAGGPPPFTYQWRHAGVILPTATNGVLQIDSVHLDDAGEYDVVVGNAYGAVTSAVSVLHVIEPLAVATQGIRRALAAYWRFDETQGLTAADSAGGHHTATLQNFSSPGNGHWTAGRVGGALRFGGPASRQCAHAADFPKTPDGTYTLSAWGQAEGAPTWASIAKNWYGQFHFGLDAGNGHLSNYRGPRLAGLD
jgi:hypothetical protein